MFKNNYVCVYIYIYFMNNMYILENLWMFA